MPRFRVASFAVLLVIALAAPALAMGNGHGRGNEGAKGGAGIGPAPSLVPAIQQTIHALTDFERRIIVDFFHTNPASLPPGLAKRQSLPPGLQRQLARNGQLPPGLRRHPLPADLRGRLPGRDGLEILVVDRDVVLVAAATLLIVDVIFDVF